MFCIGFGGQNAIFLRGKKSSSKNGLVAWGREAPLIQLFLFLFFNLLLKLLPAEPCCNSSVLLCDGWCIWGYHNLNGLEVFGGRGIDVCVTLFLYYLKEKKQQVLFHSRLIKEGYQWWQVSEYVYIENATPVTRSLKYGCLIVTLIIFMCRGRKNRWNVPKMQFCIESMSFKGQLVPAGSVSFFTLKNLNGIRKPYLSHSILTLF